MAFIRQYHTDLFPRLLDDTRFNRRRRALLGMIEAIRRQLTTLLIDPQDRTRLVDSAPIPLCTYMRGPRCATVAGPECRMAQTAAQHCLDWHAAAGC
jgi:hypothetical protein